MIAAVRNRPVVGHTVKVSTCMIKQLFNRTALFVSGLSSVAFPRVCLCCGLETTEGERQICSFCKEDRFEAGNPDFKRCSSGVILPDSVTIQHALWQFDKGGLLQDLMHYLKYERLTGIGIELGTSLGESMMRHPGIVGYLSAMREVLLLPVPLHYLKFRKRGFNQAYFIARGAQEVMDSPICDVKDVVRTKNTRSQTGFSLRKRVANIKGAFRVRRPETVAGKTVIIIDDVFTTGSTSFELAAVLKQAGCRDILIATVAQA